MKPISLTLSNFQSHRDTTLDFEQISLAVLSGPNGAGKSTLIDGIRFALFGAVRGGNLDSVVTEGEQVCRVEFEFMLGADHYIVSRQRSRKGGGSTTLTFQRFGTVDSLGNLGRILLDGKTSKDTQAAIERVLCMTDDLFTQTACANQGNAAAFSDAKPGDRKQVLADILDLTAWERKAEAARAMARDAQGEGERVEAQIESLSGQAEQAAALEIQIGELTEQQADLTRQQEVGAANVANLQADREALIARQSEDQAARRELTELQGRHTSLAAEASACSEKTNLLRQKVNARYVAEEMVKTARSGQAEAERQEGLQQEAQRLDGEIALADSKWHAAVSANNRELMRVMDDAKRLRREHEREVATVTNQIAEKRRQAEVLDRVPCAAQDATAMVEQCPLIAQAREAQSVIPQMEAALRELQEQTPWAEAEKQAAELRETRPGLAEEEQIEKIRADRERVQYDPEVHEKAKAAAATLETWLGRLTQVEEAEAQLPEAEAAEKAKRAELDVLTDRLSELTSSLGALTDWPALLSANEQRAKQAAAQVAYWRAELEKLIAQRGALVARLEAAQEAAAKVEPLRADLAKSLRRKQLFTILGNPRDGAFSKGGIPALLIEHAIPALQGAANDVLATLSDGRMAIELATQRENSTKGLSETLDVLVSDERGPRLYESFSGGERMRVDLALRIGLSQLLAARAGARCELLVLDETCAPLDAQGQAQFVECLGRVADRFATVLVVTHLSDLKDAFPTCIQVSKNGEGSRVEVQSR